MKGFLKYLSLFSLFFCFFLCLYCTSTRVKDFKVQSSSEPLIMLIGGNTRFQENHPIHPDQTLERLRELEKGQHPFAVIISCSDSRVPPELIFDQGFGDLFIIRNAGNIISDYELGSIEYAVEHLKTSLVVVMGHTNCGAMGAFIEHKHDSIPNHIQNIINYIKAEPEELELNEHNTDYYNQAIRANIFHGTSVIENSQPILKELTESKHIKIIGMIYDLETGKIEILKQ